MKEQHNGAIGVVLLNLGGPERLADVRPFLYNLFSDREIIRLGPPFMQKPIAWMIARRRAPKSRKAYELIGGGSPLLALTRQQAVALEKQLAPHGLFRVEMAMRYWQPFAGETLGRLAAAGVSRLVALTLYPHYSRATTGSSLEELRRVIAARRLPFELAEVVAWPDEPHYVQALADTIIEGMRDLPTQETELVFSAHSLPVSFIKEGDPYLEHLKKTIAAVEKLTGLRGHLCFQSRSGPVEWLAPSTPDTLHELAKRGVKRLLMVPISFVSDHVETLYEIDIQYRELAQELGMELTRTASLNSRGLFIKGLKSLVLEAAEAKGWL